MRYASGIWLKTDDGVHIQIEIQGYLAQGVAPAHFVLHHFKRFELAGIDVRQHLFALRRDDGLGGTEKRSAVYVRREDRPIAGDKIEDTSGGGEEGAEDHQDKQDIPHEQQICPGQRRHRRSRIPRSRIERRHCRRLGLREEGAPMRGRSAVFFPGCADRPFEAGGEAVLFGEIQGIVENFRCAATGVQFSRRFATSNLLFPDKAVHNLTIVICPSAHELIFPHFPHAHDAGNMKQ
jgi:hypothetical protein